MLFLTIKKLKESEHQKYTLLTKRTVWNKIERWKGKRKAKNQAGQQQSQASSLVRSQEFFT